MLCVTFGIHSSLYVVCKELKVGEVSRYDSHYKLYSA